MTVGATSSALFAHCRASFHLFEVKRSYSVSPTIGGITEPPESENQVVGEVSADSHEEDSGAHEGDALFPAAVLFSVMVIPKASRDSCRY